MKNVIKLTEDDLRATIRQCINEKMHYRSNVGQYYPNYVNPKKGPVINKPHSSAGKYIDANPEGGNYSRNKYNWSDPERGKRFDQLQDKNGLNVWIKRDMDSWNERYGKEYIESRKSSNIIAKAIDDMTLFLDNCKEKYPILKDPKYMDIFLKKVIDINSER